MAEYTNDLRIKEIGIGEEAGAWGTTLNTQLGLLAEGFSYGVENLGSDANATITMANGASDEARSLYLKITSTSLSATRTVTLAPESVSKVWIIENATTGSQSITITQGEGQHGVTIPNGQVKIVYSTGDSESPSGVYDALDNLELGGAATAATSVTAPLIEGSTSIQTPLIEYTDGDDAITIADGGGITAANGITSTAAANTFGATSFNDADITNVGTISLDSIVSDASPSVVTIGHLGSPAGNDTLVINGNVGIGESAPDRIFHVKRSDTGGTVAKFENSAGTVYIELNTDNQAGGDAGYLSYDSSKNLGLWTDDGQRVTINSVGNVGIGTLSPTSPNSVNKFLHIHDSDHSSLVMSDDQNTWEIVSNNALSIRDGSDTRVSISNAGTVTFEHPIVLQSGATQGLYIENNAGNATTPRITNDANDHTIIRPGKSGGAVQYNNFANTAELMRLSDAGDVGIGITPAARLHVYDTGAETLRLEGNDEFTYLSFRGTVSSSAQSLGVIGFANQSGTAADLNIENTQNGAMTFATNDTIRMTIDNSGHVTMPAQSSVGVQLNDQDNVAATPTVLTFGNERFDQGADFNGTTGNATLNGVTVAPYKFSAPLTGKYLVCVNLYIKNIDQAAGYYQLYVSSSNKTYYSIFDPGRMSGDPDYWDMTWAGVIDMDTNDTVHFSINQSGGTAQTDYDGQSYASITLLN